MSPNPKLAVLPWTPSDIPRIVSYFTGLSDTDAARMGIEIARFPPAAEYARTLATYQASPLRETPAFYSIWLVEGEAVGFSSLKTIKFGESGDMHLHMWKELARGKGYGGILFCLSALDFFERFQLKWVICEPSAKNPLPNRMLEKVGFTLLGSRWGRSSELSTEGELNRWQITREIAAKYVS